MEALLPTSPVLPDLANIYSPHLSTDYNNVLHVIYGDFSFSPCHLIPSQEISGKSLAPLWTRICSSIKPDLAK